MNRLLKNKNLICGLSLLGLLIALLGPLPVSAQNMCGDVELSVDVGCDNTSTDNPIFLYLRAFIRFIAGGAGLIILLMMIIGAIQFISSGGNPQTTQAALKRIGQAVVALVLFIFASAIINFLIPGGIL